jgi:hypothetical protein
MQVGFSVVALDLEVLALQRDPGRVPETEDPEDERSIHQGRLTEDLAVGGTIASGADHQARRHSNPAAHLHRPAGILALGADQDVRQDMVAGDDAGERLSYDFGALEDVLEIFGIVVQRQAPERSGSTRIMTPR